MREPILIASASFDEHTYGPVSENLERRGYPVIRYLTDKLLSGEDAYSFRLDDGEWQASINGKSISPEDIGAAWYRKVGSFAVADADTQLAKQLYLNNEVRALHESTWSLYPDDVWLSPPAAIAKADQKVGQLITAHEVGFATPASMISSDWDTIRSTFLDAEDTRFIVKMFRGVISEGTQLKSLYTTMLDEAKTADIGRYTSPFPGLYQTYQEKKREWRVTVVGEKVFPVAIYTSEAVKNDWRKLQETEAVRFTPEELSDEASEKCVRYLRRLGLGFGAFDLVEKPDGTIVFLECNPNGQYSWLEEDFGLPISQAVADELVTVAENRCR